MIKLCGNGPLYRQLYESLRQALAGGHFQAGEKLPSSRALSEQLSVSRNVVISCYEQLTAEGYIYTRTGAGSFVSAAVSKPSAIAVPSASPNQTLSVVARASVLYREQYASVGATLPAPAIDFKYGPVEINQAVINDISRITRQQRVQLQSDYQHPAGQLRLREAICRYLQLNRGCVCHPDQLVITNGSQQALDLLARALLNRGDRVLIEDPGYRGAAQAFSLAGAKLIPSAVDEDGLNPDTFPKAGPGQAAIRLVYTTPSHQFPTGGVMPLSRRMKLLEWAGRNNAYIIEDDYDSEFRYHGRPIESIQGMDGAGQTIYIGTFSKMLSPSLRVGYMVLPDCLLDPVLSLKWCTDRFSPVPGQNVLAEFLDSHLFARHIKRMRKLYATRREALITHLKADLGSDVQIQGTNAGLHLLAWVDSLPWQREQSLIDRVREKGVGIYTATSLYLQPPQRLGLLMGYARVQPEQIQRGVKIISETIQSEISSPNR